MLNSVIPFFIVDDLGATLAFYQSKLGFDVRYKGGGDGNTDDFWAIMGRDRVMLMFKAITPEVHPKPNHSRHEWARWDAFIGTDDPDSLYTEFIGREVRQGFHVPASLFVGSVIRQTIRVNLHGG